jgi:Saxitoxin biosynthesis operon protein SxtJ
MLEFLKINITRDQSKDTGMAMTLILLLLNRSFRQEAWLIGAIAALVIDMTVPQVYRPLAVVWFGLSQLIGMLTSRIILSGVFFGVVMPIGLLRRLSGKDPLNLKAFKAGSNSVMKERDHRFVAADLEKPY